MAATESCPPTELLQRLASDELSGDEAAKLVAHLDWCSRCQGRLEALASSTTLVNAGAVRPGERGQNVLQNLKTITESGSAARPRSTDWVRSFLAPPSVPDTMGTIDVYEVHEVLGQGGMGVVLKAFDTTLRRWVALKVLSPHLAGDSVARMRFAREAQAAAAIRHENVVAIHAVSEANGLPFLVMEYIAGGSLQDYLTRFGPGNWRDAVGLSIQVAQGLSAAHAQGIVHRDIKPANILLLAKAEDTKAEGGRGRAEDSSGGAFPLPPSALHLGLVKITDFGLARAIDAAQLTESGVIPGTPLYMAPEQAQGMQLDHRADLFSLGTLLYRLCAGSEPFVAESPMAILRRVCDTEPRPVRELNPQVPRWLAAVIARLHAKSPADRYSSAQELADHLRQGLDTGVVPVPRRRGRRRWLVRIAVLAALALLGALVIGLRRSETLPLRATLSGHDGQVRSVSFAPDGRSVVTASDDSSVRIWDTGSGKQTLILCEPGRSAAFARLGKCLVTAGADSWVRIWSAEGCQPIRYFDHATGDIWQLAVSPDGATAAVSNAKKLELWNLKAGELSSTLDGHQSSIRALAIAPDGQTLASADSGGTIKLWDPADGREKLSFPGDSGEILALAFAPDSATLASGGSDDRRQRVIKVWDAHSGKLQRTLGNAGSEVQALAFAPNGYLASGHHNGTIRLWNTTKDEPLVSTSAHSGGIRSLAFTPNGRTLASVGDDKLGKLWDVSRWSASP